MITYGTPVSRLILCCATTTTLIVGCSQTDHMTEEEEAMRAASILFLNVEPDDQFLFDKNEKSLYVLDRDEGKLSKEVFGVKVSLDNNKCVFKFQKFWKNESYSYIFNVNIMDLDSARDLPPDGQRKGEVLIPGNEGAFKTTFTEDRILKYSGSDKSTTISYKSNTKRDLIFKRIEEFKKYCRGLR